MKGIYRKLVIWKEPTRTSNADSSCLAPGGFGWWDVGVGWGTELRKGMARSRDEGTIETAATKDCLKVTRYDRVTHIILTKIIVDFASHGKSVLNEWVAISKHGSRLQKTHCLLTGVFFAVGPLAGSLKGTGSASLQQDEAAFIAFGSNRTVASSWDKTLKFKWS